MDSNDVVAVIQTHNAKGENCGIRVLYSDLNAETQEKLKDMKEAWDWDLECLGQSVENWVSLRKHVESIATMNNPEDEYCKDFSEFYKQKMCVKRETALNILNLIIELEQQ